MSTSDSTSDLVALSHSWTDWADRFWSAFAAMRIVFAPRPVPRVAPQSAEEITRIAKTFARAVEQIYALGGLQAGWNSYKAGPISEKAQKGAVDFLLPLHGLVPQLTAPMIFPTSDGAVGMKWRMATKQGELDLDVLMHDEDRGEYMLDLLDDDNVLIQGPVHDPAAFLEDIRKHLKPYA